MSNCGFCRHPWLEREFAIPGWDHLFRDKFRHWRDNAVAHKHGWRGVRPGGKITRFVLEARTAQGNNAGHAGTQVRPQCVWNVGLDPFDFFLVRDLVSQIDEGRPRVHAARGHEVHV